MPIDRPNIKAGRPPKNAVQALGEHVLDVANVLFIEQGYRATSMSMVASRARIGKQTLYSRYPDKAALFREVVRRRIDSIAVPPDEKFANCEPFDALKQLCSAALDTVMEPDFINLYRIIIAEALPFPELAHAAFDHWGASFVSRCVAAVEQAQEIGQCRQGEPEWIAQYLLWGLIGFPFHRALTGEVLLTQVSERCAHIEFTWRMFTLGTSRSPIRQLSA